MNIQANNSQYPVAKNSVQNEYTAAFMTEPVNTMYQS